MAINVGREDVVETMGAVREAGGRVVKEPVDAEWGAWACPLRAVPRGRGTAGLARLAQAIDNCGDSMETVIGEQRQKWKTAIAAAMVSEAADQFAAEAKTVEVMRDVCRNGFAMASAPCLRSLRDLALRYRDWPGAFVECGVARGGCLAVMALLAGSDRIVWGFDSFEGMPELTPEDEGSGADTVGIVCAPEGEHSVTRTFETLGVSMANVRVVPGWFEDTLPQLVDEIGAIALLRLDSDWYKSTKLVLDTLYDSVMFGGAIIINDYLAFTGCRRAINQFRTERAITMPLQLTDPHSEVFWVK